MARKKELKPKGAAICVVCEKPAYAHPVEMHQDVPPCVGCYNDEDLIEVKYEEYRADYLPI